MLPDLIAAMLFGMASDNEMNNLLCSELMLTHPILELSMVGLAVMYSIEA